MNHIPDTSKMVTPPDMEPGYEVATERGPGLEYWDKVAKAWVPADDDPKRPLVELTFYRRPIPKKEEKKMESTVSVKVINMQQWPKIVPVISTMQVSEAARIAQLPEVQAEVKRIQEEMAIGKGDWFRHKCGSIDRCEGKDRFYIIGLLMPNYHPDQCTKITDPAFIAFLEEGVKP